MADATSRIKLASYSTIGEYINHKNPPSITGPHCNNYVHKIWKS